MVFRTFKILLFTVGVIYNSVAQVGVNTTTLSSVFEIASSNPVAPANIDGILMPQIDVFPAVNPGADQDGMLVFLKAAYGNYKKGHYYWDNQNTKWRVYGGEWQDGYDATLDDQVYANQASENGSNVMFFDNGGLGTGSAAPVESLEIKFENESNGIQITSNDPPNAPNIIYYTRNGTFVAEDYINDEEPIGGITGSVYNGSGQSGDVAAINSAADGDHSSGNLPSRFNFSVTGSGNDSEDDDGMEMTIRASGNVGIGVDDPTAVLHLKAGTATANSAPIKLNSGTLLSTPEAGAFEFDGTHLYFTPNSNRTIVLKKLRGSATLDYLNLVAGLHAEQNVSVAGATVGSSCNCSPVGGIENGLTWSCYVSAPNTVTIRLGNTTGGAINPVSRSWVVNVIE